MSDEMNPRLNSGSKMLTRHATVSATSHDTARAAQLTTYNSLHHQHSSTALTRMSMEYKVLHTGAQEQHKEKVFGH